MAMKIDSEKIEQLRQEIAKTLELNKTTIPADVAISTMTLEAKFSTTFYPYNIMKYIKKSPDGIIGIPEKIKKSTTKKSKNGEVFLNQVTVSIRVSKKDKPVSVKIFNSGTVHFTGCICIDDLLEASYKLCVECRRDIAILDKNGKVKDIKFAKDPDQLSIEKMTHFKVDMINCIFHVPFEIDRPKLQVLLSSSGYVANYDSNGHAGVRIKYKSSSKNSKKKVTIFVFESGAIIIILGIQGFGKINKAYDFIYSFLLENYESIVKDEKLTVSSIMKYIENENKNNLLTTKIENNSSNDNISDNTSDNDYRDIDISNLELEHELSLLEHLES